MTDSPLFYDVHLFAIIRRKIAHISADSAPAAIATAQEHPATARWLNRLDDPDGVGEFADEFSHFLVDVEGDEEFEQSRWFHSGTNPLLKPLRELIAWGDSERDEGQLAALLADVRQILSITV